MTEKIAFFVIGPESSGTKMLTEALIKTGVHGSYGHHQPMDNGNFSKLPDIIVFRRSLPHARQWASLESICRRFELFGYKVVPIVILREPAITRLSQVKNGHVPNVGAAIANMKKAKEVIKTFMVERQTVTVSYEKFVADENYRLKFFKKIGRNPPVMTFYDGNKKYRKSEA